MALKDPGIPRRLWLVMMSAAICSVADITGYYLSHDAGWWPVAGVICFALCKGSVIALGLTLARRWAPAYVAAWVVAALFIALSVTNVTTYLLYGFGISRKLLMILYETNSSEVRQFMPGLIENLLSAPADWRLWIAAVAFAALWWVVPKIPARWWYASTGIVGVAGIAYFGWVAATAEWGKSNHAILARSGLAVKSVAKSIMTIRQLSSMQRPLPYAESARSQRLANNLVLVIGESASRDHHSLYGYPLPTTPRMTAMADSLVIFHDAVASSTATAENLPRILTFMNCEPESGEWYEYPTMHSLFKAFGYTTWWLSNQERTGEWSNLSGILSSDADVVKYLGSTDSEDHLNQCYDEVLLPELRGALDTTAESRFICLHLLGSHTAYRERYPTGRGRITATDVMSIHPKREWLDEGRSRIVAQYDNSILYTDSILSEIIKDLSLRAEPSLMVYFSDHGENVYDDRDFRGRDPKYVRVPFIIYANRSYRENNPEIMASLQSAGRQAFSTADVIHMLVTLSGSSYRMYDTRCDILSPQFRRRVRYVDGEPFHLD